MSDVLANTDTIAAQATPAGKGGVGIIRLSGSLVEPIAIAILGKLPVPRYAGFSDFFSGDGSAIDQGISLYFNAPDSFTGEDVLELHGHGGPVVMNLLLTRVLELGARVARPGEFSERAFLNNKIDLSQAEAIADLIDSASDQAAKSALRSLQGEFSKKVNAITQRLIELRVYVEAAIDFPEEEIDFLLDPRITSSLDQLLLGVENLIQQASQGALLREGVRIVLAGRPNAGKSSLMNSLTGRETSIVTEVAGTTRDVINEQIHLDGMPVRLIDTAGLREGNNVIEKEGVRRAVNEIDQADYVLIVVDAFEHRQNVARHINALVSGLPKDGKYLVILNKADLCEPRVENLPFEKVVVSAKTGAGIDDLKQRLKTGVGFDVGNEGTFIARRRHLDALRQTLSSLRQGKERFEADQAGELLAEELRCCQRFLGEITGEFTSDELLGRIFSSFCIGK